VFRKGHLVRSGHILGVDDSAALRSPDVEVIARPERSVLVVEVADTSLLRDRRLSALYARNGVADYWIVNLVDGVLEVYREPVRSAGGRWKYRSVRLLRPGARVSPLAAPRARIRVADLLP
jgi:Uma2 family endonuclease